VVVPFYNPGDRLRPTIVQLLSELEDTRQSFEVIAVSDGSTDGSARSVDDLVGDRLRVIELDRNYGKGEALRVGMSSATGGYIGFIDADGDIAPSFMARFAEQAARDHPDGLLGSKNHPDSAIHPAPVRRLLSVVWQSLVKLLFQFPVSDSQAGIKLFRQDVVRRALPLTSLTGFAFDLELLVVAHDLGYTDFVETPIEIAERDSSTVSLRTTWRMLTDLGVIFWRTRVRSKVRDRRSPADVPHRSPRSDDDVSGPPADRHDPTDVPGGEVHGDHGTAL
jgi:glycosyltransferase involved in cell wall biosynthesis